MFTPKPWTTEPHGNTTALYSGRIPNQHGLRLMNLDDGDSNFENNLRLIENAPELYEELSRLVATLDSLGHYIDTSEAKKVLAKIEG